MRFHVPLIAAAALLPGCAGANGTFTPMSGGYTANDGQQAQTAPQYPLVGKGVAPANRTLRHSWMEARAKSHDLLYATDYLANAVYVYTYPAGHLVGQLTGLSGPAGECADAKGDIFVANVNGADIVEYAHGGTSPIATLTDTGYEANGCAIDPVTGNLAVTNLGPETGRGSGNVAVYAGAKGKPIFYSDPSFDSYAFCSYDKHGNLFFDGGDTGYNLVFAELSKGSPTPKSITLNQKFSQATIAGGVQALSDTVTVGDSDAGVVYQFSTSGSTGTETSSTHLSRTHFFYDYTINGLSIVGPAYDKKGGRVRFWSFPAGGNSTFSITGPQDPVGTAISPAR